MKNNKRFSISMSGLTVIAIAVSTLAAVVFCIAIFTNLYSKALMNSAKVNAEQTVKQAAVAVDNDLLSMKTQLYNVSNLLTEAKDAQTVSASINVLTDVRKEIFAVTVYGENGEIVFCVGGDYPLKKNIYKDLSFDRELFDSLPEFSLSKPHVQTVFEGNYPWVVTAALKSESPIFGTGVYIAVDFSFDRLADYIDRAGIGQHGYCYIADADGNVIYHPQQQVLFSGLKSESITVPLNDGVFTEKNKITAIDTVGNGIWKTVGISYTDEIEKEKTSQIFFSISAALICCLAVAGTALLIYRKLLNKPMRELIRAMKSFETQADRFSYAPRSQSVTEMAVLNDSFVHMAATIKGLMEQVRREQTELRKTELKALQAQINPHFLYNTLDSIQWMCEQGKTESAAAMVSALAKLFRISISRGKELIPIKDEIRHAESYLVIQSYRYRNQFTYRFDTDKNLENYLCNKITVQPLIENAIYHGIDRMVDEGEITVSVKRADDCADDILITVSDNGIGMTDEQCESILRKGRSGSGGIGVKNVNDRLKIYFGDKYGLTIKSELDVGTTVTVRIPKIDKEREI